ncbi:MAG: trypsin-like serine protease [Polyangiales bacterium]
MKIGTLLTLGLLGACAEVGQGGDDGYEDESILAIENGAAVRGAGPNQEWEGIVMTSQTMGRGYCSASFITDRHLVSASHCYGADGPQRVGVRAPTLNGGTGWQVFERAVVKRAGTSIGNDIAVVDLGAPQAWATPERRFMLNASPGAAAQLHLYGYGANTEAGAGVGTLRGAPLRATVAITDSGRGYLFGTTGEARFCKGDSGGPALREGTAPVLWGINASFVPTAARSRSDRQPVCAEVGSRLRFTSVAANLAFIEQTLGKPCTRVEVDGLQTARCW